MINEQPKKKSALLPVCQIHAFDGHSYKVLDNEEMAVLSLPISAAVSVFVATCDKVRLPCCLSASILSL